MAADQAACRGFTLLEAMVALIIVSLGMMAVSDRLNQYAAAAVQTEQATLASWIATNKLTELSVGPVWPAVGESKEDVDFAGQKWHCEIKVEETPVKNLHRVDVSVSLQTDPAHRVVRKVSALIEPPAPPGFLPPQWSSPRAGGQRG
jgi:general secretion pathway protein I